MNNTRGSDKAFYSESMIRGIALGTTEQYSAVVFEQWKLLFAAYIKETYNKQVVFI